MRYLIAISLSCLLMASNATGMDARGNVSVEFSYFSKSTLGVNNYRSNSATAVDITLTQDLADNVRLTVQPFMRWDRNDDERSKLDIRTLMLTTNGDAWEFNAGIGTVFWGVTESFNPVDVINQSDTAEGNSSEDKLGQLMLNLKWFSDYGEFEGYLLPRFHERTFKGINGRPFGGIGIDSDLATFESKKDTDHIDIALRWLNSYDIWDIGLHAFHGTSRTPVLAPQQTTTGTTPGLVLAPRYSQMTQVGLAAQGLFGDLAVKAELVHRDADEFKSHVQTVSGLEYTLVGLLSPLQDNETLPEEWCDPDNTNMLKKLACNDRLDLGIVVEHLWDQRGTESNQPFQNDLLTGFRFTFNDAASSDALLGVIQDLDGGASILSFEASTRFLDSYRITVETRQYLNTEDDSALQPFANESYYQAEIAYFF